MIWILIITFIPFLFKNDIASFTGHQDADDKSGENGIMYKKEIESAADIKDE